MHRNCSIWHLLVGWVCFIGSNCILFRSCVNSELMGLLLFEFSGIVLCLVFNVIAVIVCWIKGGGELFLLLTIHPMKFVIGMLVLKS